MEDMAFMRLCNYEKQMMKAARTQFALDEQERKICNVHDYILSEYKRQMEKYGDAPVYVDPVPIMKELGVEIPEKLKEEWLLKYQENQMKGEKS